MSGETNARANPMESFLGDLGEVDLETIVSTWMLERVPHVFAGNSDKYVTWKHELSNRIGVDARAISLIGSSAVGFSLNPNKNYKAFDSASDVDVAVISDHHFDIAWNWMRNLGAERYRYPPKVIRALLDHQERLVYYGSIATDKILQLLPFAKDWLSAQSYVAGLPPIDGREVNIRIYRDFFALRAYQISNLRHLRDEYLKKPAKR